jgi:hypothetical protein
VSTSAAGAASAAGWGAAAAKAAEATRKVMMEKRLWKGISLKRLIKVVLTQLFGDLHRGNGRDSKFVEILILEGFL